MTDAASSGTTTAPAEPADEPSLPERASNTLLNGFVGSAVSVLALFFVGPYSSILGGAVAGYLEGGDLSDGVTVGTIAGFVTVVPVLLFAGAVLALGVFVPEGLPFGIVLLAIATLLTILVVGLSAVGGVVGVYVKQLVHGDL